MLFFLLCFLGNPRSFGVSAKEVGALYVEEIDTHKDHRINAYFLEENQYNKLLKQIKFTSGKRPFWGEKPASFRVSGGQINFFEVIKREKKMVYYFFFIENHKVLTLYRLEPLPRKSKSPVQERYKYSCKTQSEENISTVYWDEEQKAFVLFKDEESLLYVRLQEKLTEDAMFLFHPLSENKKRPSKSDGYPLVLKEKKSATAIPVTLHSSKLNGLEKPKGSNRQSQTAETTHHVSQKLGGFLFFILCSLSYLFINCLKQLFFSFVKQLLNLDQ